MPVDFSILPRNIAEAASELAKKIDFESINDKGGNGFILIGHNTLINRKVAVKFYYWGDGAHAEPRFLSELASTHVLKVDDAAPIDKDYAYFITPFCEEGDLDDVIRKGGIGVKCAVDILLDIASGASFIHGKGFLHRDLKPSNIFCEKADRFVIGDFGSVAKKGNHGYVETGSRHSLLYRTPEEVRYNRAYEQSDVYQIGIILYQLLGGSLPYEERFWLKSNELLKFMELTYPDNQIYSNEIIEQRIIKGKLLDLNSLPPWCPSELVSLIRQCCRLDHAARVGSASALMAKVNNLRASLPDWRLEPHPILHRTHAKFRVVEVNSRYSIEKMAKSGTSWRKVHAENPSSIKEAIEVVQRL
jgi:serine/threonine protein kinase